MKTFDQKLLRLKQAVSKTEDQEVAALLGMSKAAFAVRKSRDTFPAEKLYALAQKHPELKIDVAYVLNGPNGTAGATPKKLPGSAAHSANEFAAPYLPSSLESPSGQAEMKRLLMNTKSIMQMCRELNYEPAMVWSALLQELMIVHGLTEAGAKRVLETLKEIGPS